MRNVMTFVFVCFALNVFSQTDQQEINEQVWKPFIKSFNDRDTKAFMAVHSDEVIRSPRDDKAVWNKATYYEQQKKGDDREKASGKSKRILELHFTERLA